ncbi:NEPrilysin metallopeptidase family [Caenorhabditis elegans]|uniref:NEPrilysin metallopeptidase family n=1 Tax=Caenorhabditis elegans TaxID=6239 RepID=Q400M1_CAEEL|nr:NEPrilysin metallopeptidase family [Caenorhabditis elegans]CCD68926.2 NEPrilysin metallopeptidase family [Caenorhabditis elegans]|eukprot:NP_001342017.1 NEPrilysin metallopeptidase family [Caenorhabditis elegans]
MNERDTENSRLLSSTQNLEVEEDGEEEGDDNEKVSKCCIYPLISIIICLVIIAICMGAVIVFWRMDSAPQAICKTDHNKTRDVCKTAECITLSSTLLNWQNTNIDPCEDFYEYSCGRYQEHTLNDGIRANEKDTIVMKLIRQFVLKNQSTTSNSENALMLLYEKCSLRYRMENRHQETEVIQREVFENIRKIGSWPIADKNWNSSHFNLNNMLSNMASIHMLPFGLFETRVIELYPMNTTAKQLVIRPTKLKFSIPQEELVRAIRDLLSVNGITSIMKKVKEDVAESFALDKEIGNIHIDPQPKPATLSELQKAVPDIDFERIIKSYLNPKTGNWSSLRTKIFSARFELFFGKNNNLSSIIARTKPRILANYLFLKYIEYAYFFFFDNTKVFSDDDFCTEVVTTSLPRASLRVFVRNHFKKENMAVASEIVEVVKTAYVEIINNSTWLHNSTRESAIEKVVKMKKVIGYTEEYERTGALDEMFETLQLSRSDSFFVLMTKVNRFKIEQLMDFVSSDSLLNPIEPLVMANAFYFPTKNLLNVLVPFLDKPLFDFKYPRYVAMAGVGRVLAHEIGHAFDINGRQTDEIGRTRDWWTREDTEEYDRRSECFAEQFTNFKDPSFKGKQNGTEVLAEIIADALGMEASWIAFKKINLTEEQGLIQFEDHDFGKLYFQVAALDFCAPSRIEERYSDQLSHPTNKFRINGAFSNSRAFADTYKCPVGSKMNPVQRCDMF